MKTKRSVKGVSKTIRRRKAKARAITLKTFPMPGTTIYITTSFGSVDQVHILSRPYPVLLSCGRTAFAKSQKVCSWGNYKKTFSLRDAGIIPNRYNNHKAFFTKAAAEKYCKQLMNNDSNCLDDLGLFIGSFFD